MSLSCEVTDTPCFGLLVTSALGFKARFDPFACMLCCPCATESGGGVSASRVGVGKTPPPRSAYRGAVCIQGGWADPPPRYMGYYEIRSTSGRYASYWSAFLLLIITETEQLRSTAANYI